MSTKLFDQLYTQAVEREHAAWQCVHKLWHSPGIDGSFFSPDLPMLASLAKLLLPAYQRFQADLYEVAISTGMRIQPGQIICLHCGSTTCLGAEPCQVMALDDITDPSTKQAIIDVLKHKFKPK